MRKIFLACLPFLLYAVSISAQTVKTDEELLEETVRLSQEVKEFGRSLGIDPSPALSKSINEQKPLSQLKFYFQKRGSLDLETFISISLGFNLDSAQMPIAHYWLWSKQLSIFVRQIDEFAGEDSVITPLFAKRHTAVKVNIILHEDLHGVIHATSESALAKTLETLVTPLGFLAAREFFISKNDKANAEEASSNIDFYRKMSVELNAFEKEFGILAQNAPLSLACHELYEKNVFDRYPVLYKKISSMLRPLTTCVGEEAAITHELTYFKYFDRVVELYEISGSLIQLISDMKNAPARSEDLELFLNALDKKYSIHDQTPLP